MSKFVFEDFENGFVLMKLQFGCTYDTAVTALTECGLIERATPVRGRYRVNYKWVEEFSDVLEAHGYNGVASVIAKLRKEGLILNSRYATLFKLALK